MTTSTHKELIDILNEISGGKINEVSDKQTQALIDLCALLSQRLRGIVPPPPPPLPTSLSKVGRAFWPVVEGMEVKAKEVKAGENAIKPPKPAWKQRDNKNVNSIVQQINQGVKLKPIKIKEKDGKKEEVNTVKKKIQDPSTFSIKDRFKLWKK